jgi:hypothetical protein
MSAQPILLDFKDRPRRGGIVGAVLMVLGVAGVVLVGLQFHASSQARAGLELRLDALASARAAGEGAARSVNTEEAGPMVSELGAPWSMLLQELESASQDLGSAVAVLAVEPDRAKGRIRIVAETKDLPTALAYVERLQKSHALRFPMLDSHERRTEEREQPVRFQLSAEWRTAS